LRLDCGLEETREDPAELAELLVHGDTLSTWIRRQSSSPSVTRA
jgi:hypothetical protein